MLESLENFSSIVLTPQLYPYQLQAARPIVESVLGRKGREFLLVMPRQSGKNEVTAHILVYLMNLLQRIGGHIVYAAPKDALGRGIQRLEEKLQNPLNAGLWNRTARPTGRNLGRSSVVFLSSHPAAAVRGETANWLLVVDEMQDQILSHIMATFEPMRAADNATALYLGTVRTRTDALWQKKQELHALERQDGIKRVMEVQPAEVIEVNERYGRFLDGQIAKYGRNHPIVASEYFNTPIDAHDALFDARRRALMQGKHQRRKRPEANSVYIATIDVGGQDEAATGLQASGRANKDALSNPDRDYTAATIFSIKEGDGGLIYRAVDSLVDIGSRHFQESGLNPSLARRLKTWLNHWRVTHVIADASGVGSGLADWLEKELTAAVTGVVISPKRKAEIGLGFLSAIETGRFKWWNDEQEPLSDSWWFFTQARHCTYYVPEGGRLEVSMKWSVPDGSKIDTPIGLKPVHDDRLFSAALIAVADELHSEGKLKAGIGKAAIVDPEVILEPIY